MYFKIKNSYNSKYLSKDSVGNCEKCPSNCDECTSATVCTICKTGKFLIIF